MTDYGEDQRVQGAKTETKKKKRAKIFLGPNQGPEKNFGSKMDREGLSGPVFVNTNNG